ncbi:hypothetical protein BH24ACT22_BH24ACT22_10950 [soil metagenome]
MPEHFFFILGFCFLLAHEMDAIRSKEWKIFPGLSRMSDEAGYVTFTALHVPTYALLFWGLRGEGSANPGLITGLDVFFIVHFLLHVVFYNHPKNRFRSMFSYVLISGASVCGVADLVLS